MSDKAIRGPSDAQIIQEDRIVRDTRTLGGKIIDWLRVPRQMATALLAVAAISFAIPAILDLCLLIAVGLTAWGLTRTETLPLKFPVMSGRMDPHERHPATGKPSKANGIFFLGNELKTGKEVWLTNSDCRQHFLVLGTTGAGKSLPLDSRVHTPTGWRRMGDLKVGDVVSTPDGRSAPITGYYPQGELDICRITFADGRVAEACPEHLWEVHHKHWNGKYKQGVSRAGAARPRLLRTREIADLLKSNKGTFSVRLPEAVEKPASDLPIDPYLLGALVGDGNVTGKVLRFSTADAFIAERVSSLLAPMGHELIKDRHGAGCDYRIRLEEPAPGHASPLRLALRRVGIEGLHSYEKFIPACYKEASVAQRWALVQGLMDTDGTADARHGAISFSTSSERLAKDFQEIVWSLGGIAKISVKNPSYTGASGERMKGRISYIVQVRHPDPSNFFSLPRKLALVEGEYQYANSLKLGIKSVEVVRRAQAACILVDHPDHLFITDNYVVTHNTEALLGFAANAVTWGSGFLFCDGKGDVALFAKVYALCRRFGREDDLLVLNFMTGNQDVGGSTDGKLRSNTLNPFATGSSDTLTQMVVGLMDDAGGDGAMWKGRATAMFTGVMRALTWLRDQHIVDLNVGEIRDHLQLRRIIDLADQAKFPEMPQHIRKSIKSYLSSLPGFQEDKGYKQAQTTLDQHGYLEMQFTKILGSLADVYGHIFKTPYGEIDMADVVLNRRILVVMLPALEKASDEIANLGKIVVATLKGMMGGTLGSQIEGNWYGVVEQRPTTSPTPFICILDEVGYYMVDGMDLMSAQARSLGFCLVFAGQDINAMKRINEKVFGSVQGNTNTKIVMRTEDPDTAKIAIEAAGKAYRAQLKSYEGKVGEMGKSYMDDLNAQLELIDRINPLDLKAQDEGEMHILHKEWLVRAKSFYAAPEGSLNRNALNLRANHFITVAKPDPDEIASHQRLPELVSRLVDPDFAKQMKSDAKAAADDLSVDDEISALGSAIREIENSNRKPSNPVEIACAAFAKLILENKSVTDAYAEGVRAAGGIMEMPGGDYEDEPIRRDPRMRRDRQLPPHMQDHGGFSGFDEYASDLPPEFAGDPRHHARPVRPDMHRSEAPFQSDRHDRPTPPKRPFARQLGQGRLKKDVPHGAQVDNGELLDMADRIASNDGFMRTLAALDFDAAVTNRDQVHSLIEEALSGDGDKPVVDSSKFDRGAAEKADLASRAVLEDFDEGFDDDESGGITTDFLGALLEEDEDEEGNR